MTLPRSVVRQATPASTTIIQPTRGIASLQLNALWQYRELLYFLVWRDVKVRYKQTALGVAWIVLQPVISTVVFTLLFGDAAEGAVRRRALSGLCTGRRWCRGTTSPDPLTRSSTSLVGSATPDHARSTSHG